MELQVDAPDRLDAFLVVNGGLPTRGRAQKAIEDGCVRVNGWKKDDGSVDMVQILQNMDALEYLKGMSWAIHDVTSKL